MQYLLMYIGEGVKFERPRVEESIVAIDGIADVRTIGAVACSLECEFAVPGDSTILRLSDDSETVSIHGTGAAATQFAVEFQRDYGGEIHLIDTEYSFDHVLDGTQSASDVRQWLEEGGHE